MTHNIRSTLTDVNYLQAPVENGNGHSVTPHTEEAEEDTEAALPSSQQPKRSLEETAEPEAAAPESKRPCVESETNQPPPAPAAPNGVNSTPPQPIATGGDWAEPETETQLDLKILYCDFLQCLASNLQWWHFDLKTCDEHTAGLEYGDCTSVNIYWFLHKLARPHRSATLLPLMGPIEIVCSVNSQLLAKILHSVQDILIFSNHLLYILINT